MPNEEKKIWGIHTKDDNLFLRENLIAIGWREMGDLSKIDTNRDAFKEKYIIAYPDAKKRKYRYWSRYTVPILL